MKPTRSIEYFAPRPTPVTLYFRTFWLWQLIRFVIINIRMMNMISKSHGKKIR
ncbi:hypothetical protein [Spirobacillus cienkowskii]|uniref:hypothetical protein n=1 Tax=Spirobacillus cienkowskii TaxID=495820 RepID=UPI0030D376B5